MNDRRDMNILVQDAKFKRLTNHPMNQGMSQPVCRRLKRNSFLHQAKELIKQNTDLHNHTPKELPTCLSVPHGNQKPSQTSTLRTRGYRIQKTEDISQMPFSTYGSIQMALLRMRCGLRGNELADTLAKQGAHLEQIDSTTTYSEEKTIIKSCLKRKWKLEHPKYNKADAHNQLERHEQVVIFSLRTNHNKLKQHLYRTFKV